MNNQTIDASGNYGKRMPSSSSFARFATSIVSSFQFYYMSYCINLKSSKTRINDPLALDEDVGLGPSFRAQEAKGIDGRVIGKL